MPLVIRLTWCLVAAAGLAACGDANGAHPDPPGTAAPALERVASGLSFPLYATAPAGDDRLFIVEKGGRIRILDGDELLATPFLDIRNRVSTGSEQGLLGLAFPADFAETGRYYVNYTDNAGDTRIAAYRSADGRTTDPATEAILLTVDQPFSNHNGGHLAFGPDGMLYVAMGDGGSGGDPQGNGQDRTDLLGSLLRLDVSAGDRYVIPPDNPWAGGGGRGELWDYGLRNPWRFSFDRETGDLWIGDVGQNAREEINVATAASGAGRGLNYGWVIMEGRDCFRADDCNQQGLTLPVHDYTHADGCSVTGGYVYRGQAAPSLRGHYLYADYCEGWVRSLRLENGSAVDHREWTALAPGGSIPSFGEDAAGELYVLDSGGEVYRIVER